VSRRRAKSLWAAAAGALLLASTAAAVHSEQAKDADLPPEIRRLPFEIRDGYRRFAKRCLGCHDRKRVDAAKKTLFEWQGVIGTMALKKEARIPLEDRQPIFLYLAYLHGTRGSARERDEYLTFLTRCEDCHGVGLVYRERKPLPEWPSIVHRMAGKGQAHISADDEAKIMAYIRRMHPDLFGVD